MKTWPHGTADAGRPGGTVVTTAGEIMSAPVITVDLHASRAHIADTLTAHRISAAPVVNDAGAVVGLVSEYDLLAKVGDDASELMTTAIISVSADWLRSASRGMGSFSRLNNSLSSFAAL